MFASRFIRTAIAASCLAGSAAFAQDVLQAAPNHYKVRVDNADVRVIENVLAPGEKDPTHTHPAGGYYVTLPGKMKVVRADGTSEIWDAKAGEAGWMEAEGPHTSENIGAAPMGFVLVEVKSAAAHAPAKVHSP